MSQQQQTQQPNEGNGCKQCSGTGYVLVDKFAKDGTRYTAAAMCQCHSGRKQG